MKQSQIFRRVVTALALIVMTASVVVGVFYFLIVNHFNVPPPRSDYPKPRSVLEAQRQDLDYFGKLMALDRSYSPEGYERAKAKLAQLKKLDHSMPRPELEVSLMQLIALADNGHSVASLGPPIMTLPLRVAPFSDGFYIMRAKEPYRALLGGRVIAIDGVPFAKILRQIETLQGGTKPWRYETSASLIPLQDVLYGLRIAHDPNRSNWTVLQPDGHIVTASVQADALSRPIMNTTVRWLSPEPFPWMDKSWLAYAPVSGHLPESLQSYDSHFLLIHMPDSCAIYIRLENITDFNDQRIMPFLEETENTLQAHHPCAAIVDLRGNHGGDYDNTRHFAQTLPKLVTADGPIYLLTDGQTFSAAITTAAFFKEAGGNRVKIVGEPPGDRLTFYSEGRSGCLPNTKMCIRYQLAKHDYSHICLQRDCWWRNWFYPVRVSNLEPDEIIPRRFSDWNRGHDAAYEWVARAVSKQ